MTRTKATSPAVSMRTTKTTSGTGGKNKMNVLVTGGAGVVGKFVVDELLRRGHCVTVAGRRAGVEIEGARYAVLDCTNYDDVVRVVGEHESVVHLAGIPQPHKGTSAQIFDNNCRGTYNVYEACAEVGIKKLSVSSSYNALGSFYGVKELPIRYFPIDEDHPQLCSDPYSFSKQVVEDIGEYFWHKNGISSISVRIPWVVPCDEGQERLKWRRRDPGEFFLIRNLWIWIDARDSANIFCDGIEKPYEGFHVLFANDKVNNIGVPSRELAARFYPQVTEWREDISGYDALVSCRRAKEVLGWQPIFNTVTPDEEP